MKPDDHPVHTRLPYGLEGQTLVKPRIESHITEPIVFTSATYDTMDAESDSYWIEIKRRSKQYHWSQPLLLREGILIPACKIERAKTEQKTVRFYYLWDSDDSLWFWDYNEKDLLTCRKDIPPWHRDKQEHYYLPQRVWSSV
jgi:hypothetical protein